MYCTNCGKQLPDTVKFCTECGTPTGFAAPVQEPSAAPVSQPIPRRYRGLLSASVIACVLFFLPTGLIAVLSAVKAIRLSDAGDAAAAAKPARRARVLMILSFVFGALWNLFGLYLLAEEIVAML